MRRQKEDGGVEVGGDGVVGEGGLRNWNEETKKKEMWS